jgi:non-specific serine/threonine protein kinase
VSVRSWLLFYQGLALRRLGKEAAGAAAYEEAIRVAQTQGQMFITSAAHVNLAASAAATGQHDRAKALGGQGLAYARQVADPWLISFALYGIAQRAKMRGDLRDAAESYRESLAQTRPITLPWGTNVCLIGLADIACASGDHARAARLLGAADHINRTIGISLIPRVQEDHDRGVLAARTAMGADVFEKAYAEGRAMTLEQAIEYALAEN